MEPEQVYVYGAVEGNTDEIVLRRMCELADLKVATIYGKNGKDAIRQSIDGYNNAARFAPWVVLVDLDTDFDCAPPLLSEWLDQRAEYLCFRVAVHEVESWLLADAKGLAGFLRVPRALIPREPDAVLNPKVELISIARQSRNRAIREDMVPRVESGRVVGPAYASRLDEFASSLWSVSNAEDVSDSLSRAIRCLCRLKEHWLTRRERQI